MFDFFWWLSLSLELPFQCLLYGPDFDGAVRHLKSCGAPKPIATWATSQRDCAGGSF